jgi:hypothetical protein
MNGTQEVFRKVMCNEDRWVTIMKKRNTAVATRFAPINIYTIMECTLFLTSLYKLGLPEQSRALNVMCRMRMTLPVTSRWRVQVSSNAADEGIAMSVCTPDGATVRVLYVLHPYMPRQSRYSITVQEWSPAQAVLNGATLLWIYDL